MGLSFSGLHWLPPPEAIALSVNDKIAWQLDSTIDRHNLKVSLLKKLKEEWKCFPLSAGEEADAGGGAGEDGGEGGHLQFKVILVVLKIEPNAGGGQRGRRGLTQ